MAAIDSLTFEQDFEFTVILTEESPSTIIPVPLILDISENPIGRAVRLSNNRFWIEYQSTTYHGRVIIRFPTGDFYTTRVPYLSYMNQAQIIFNLPATEIYIDFINGIYIPITLANWSNEYLPIVLDPTIPVTVVTSDNITYNPTEENFTIISGQNSGWVRIIPTPSLGFIGATYNLITNRTSSIYNIIPSIFPLEVINSGKTYNVSFDAVDTIVTTLDILTSDPDPEVLLLDHTSLFSIDPETKNLKVISLLSSDTSYNLRIQVSTNFDEFLEFSITIQAYNIFSDNYFRLWKFSDCARGLSVKIIPCSLRSDTNILCLYESDITNLKQLIYLVIACINYLFYHTVNPNFRITQVDNTTLGYILMTGTKDDFYIFLSSKFPPIPSDSITNKKIITFSQETFTFFRNTIKAFIETPDVRRTHHLASSFGNIEFR